MTISQRIKKVDSANLPHKKTRAITNSMPDMRRISHSEMLEKLAKRTRELEQSLDREKILADMVRSASIAIDIAYPDGHVSHCNPAFFELIGYNESELSNINWVELTPPEFRAFEAARLEEVRRTGKAVRYEKEYIRKDGSRVPIELVVQPKYNRNGKFESYFGFISDITQRKLIEEQLRAAREQLDRIVSMNPAAIYLGKPYPDFSDFVCTYISKNVISVTGFDTDKFVEDTEFWKSRVHPDDLRIYFTEIPSLWQNNHDTFEYRFLHKDETYHWIREEVNVVHQGSDIEVVGCWTDITDRKRMEGELKSAREQLEYVVSSNPAMVYLGKPTPDYSRIAITYVSRNILSLFGFEPKEVIGHPELWTSRVHADDLPRLRANGVVLWREGHNSFEYRFLHKNGAYRWIREEQKVIQDSEGHIRDVVGYASDITERKKFEEKLLRSERFATIGELAAMVGHDLRNPLQSISGATYFLEKKFASYMDKKEREMFDAIKAGIKYSNSILTELLEYSRELNLQTEPIILKTLTGGALALVGIPQNIHVIDESKEIPVKVDLNQMQRALVNLVENAIEAMPDGGRMTIEGKEVNGRMEISISDTGAGISRDRLGKIWAPLYTTKSKGIGLGLAITKRIVEAHDGSVTVESVLGQGSKFTISLPMQ